MKLLEQINEYEYASFNSRNYIVNKILKEILKSIQLARDVALLDDQVPSRTILRLCNNFNEYIRIENQKEADSNVLIESLQAEISYLKNRNLIERVLNKQE